MGFKSIVAAVVWPFDRGLALLACGGVWVYRKCVSPFKGFRCAAGATREQPSCSDVALVVLWTKPLSEAVPIIRGQLGKCRQAYVEYRADLLQAADAHLSRMATLGAAGTLYCCDGCPPPTPTTTPYTIQDNRKPPISRLSPPAAGEQPPVGRNDVAHAPQADAPPADAAG